MRKLLALTLIVSSFAVLVSVANADHSWGSYHWARTSNPSTIQVVDSNTSDWENNLDRAITDWNSRSVMNVVKAAGAEDRRCRPIAGKVRSCNGRYGQNGWLGLAQIWVTGGHISQGTAKMNDTYLASGSYTETNRQHVMCQEIGHAWGLGHQDESGADLGTCMDYANALDNPSPNKHDYDQLATIYSHLDTTTTIGASTGSLPGNAKPFSKASRANGSVYVDHLPGGVTLLTHVFWAPYGD